MGKIEAINSMTNEIVETIERMNKSTMNVNRKDLYFLVDKFNEVNTTNYKYKDVEVCSDCRRHVYDFWRYAVEQWKKNLNK